MYFHFDLCANAGGGGWSPWVSGTCSKTCGEGTSTDVRRCLAHISCCPGNSSRTVICTNPTAPGDLHVVKYDSFEFLAVDLHCEIIAISVKPVM